MTNPNIQIEPMPEKKRAKSQNLEGKIQASIVKWFGETYPNRRGALVGYFAETENKTDGGVKTARGLVAGVSDLLYFTSSNGNKCVIGCEIKALGTWHNVKHLENQALWMLEFCEDGFFIDSLEMFKNVILTGYGGISPKLVLERLRDIKTETVLWDKVRS